MGRGTEIQSLIAEVGDLCKRHAALLACISITLEGLGLTLSSIRMRTCHWTTSPYLLVSRSSFILLGLCGARVIPAEQRTDVEWSIITIKRLG